VVQGGSADRAGVKAGDRLLAVGDRPAILERSTFDPVTRQPPGTAVPVVVVRDGARRESTLHLVRLLVP
jgi:S1-C subfamily serine protease